MALVAALQKQVEVYCNITRAFGPGTAAAPLEETSCVVGNWGAHRQTQTWQTLRS